MYKITCKELNPNTDCTFEASGEEKKQVVGKMFSHVKSDHMEDMKGKGDAEIRSMIEEKVMEV